MPYRRYNKRRYKRRRYKRRGGYTTMGSAMFLAKKAYRGIRYLKGLVNAEKFHLDTTYSGQVINSTGVVTHLSAIAQGDNDPGRSGNSIYVRGISFSFSLNMNASATNTWVRFVMLIDTQQVGDTAPSLTDVFESNNVGALMNHLTLGRYNILIDKVYTFNISNLTAIQRKGYKSMRHHVRFNGTASTDVQKGGIYLMWVSNEGTNTPVLTGMFRVFYHDN